MAEWFSSRQHKESKDQQVMDWMSDIEKSMQAPSTPDCGGAGGSTGELQLQSEIGKLKSTLANLFLHLISLSLARRQTMGIVIRLQQVTIESSHATFRDLTQKTLCSSTITARQK